MFVQSKLWQIRENAPVSGELPRLFAAGGRAKAGYRRGNLVDKADRTAVGWGVIAENREDQNLARRGLRIP